MTVTAGYIVDMHSVKLDDDGQSSWIQAMPLGEYDHPVHGKIQITPERVHQFAQNITQRVRGTDLDIDFDHKADSKEAAGWVQAADARDNGLWILVKWTKGAYQKLKEGAYRYFSPEFVDEWTHPKTGQKHKDVLFGGGLTNRPFLRDILPINMSEVIKASGGSGMNPDEVLKEIGKLLGLPDGSDPALILGHVQAKLGSGNQPPQHANPPSPGGPPKPPSPSGPPQFDEKTDPPKEGAPTAVDDAAMQKLLSENPMVKQLMETITSQGKQLDEASVDKSIIQLSEKAKNKNKIIPPAVTDDLKKQLSAMAPDARPGIIALFETMIDSGQIGVDSTELGESSHSGGKSAEQVFMAEVNKVMGEAKLSFADASEQVARSRPTMYVDYVNSLSKV